MSQNHQDNPLLHPPFYVIPGISPNAPVSAQVQQIDQRNTLLLQEIDANFAKFHQVITSKILPEIKRFAIGSEPVREASQFWRSFFETAAANRVNLEGDTTASGQDTHQEASNRQHQYDDHTVTSDHLSQIHNDDASFMFATSSTPLPGRGHPGQSGTREGMRNGVDESWEDSLDSPFDRMDRRLHDLKFTNSNDEISSDMPTPSLPSGYSMPRMDGTGSSSIDELSIADYSTGTVERKDIPEFHSRQILEPRSQDGGRSSHWRQSNEDYNSGDTPKAKYGNHRVTDLRTTPLNARFSKASSSGQGKGKEKACAPQQAKIPYMDPLADFSDDDDDDLIRMAMSPPVTMNFSLPPRAQAIMQAGKTPVKSRPPSAPSSTAPHQTFEEELSRQDAASKDEGEARMILDDLLEEMSTSNYEPSPRMPTPEGLGRYSIAPGDIGTSARLLFQDDQHPERQATRRSVGANTSYGSDIITQSDQPTPYGDDEESFDEDSFDSDAGQTVHNPGQYDHPGRQSHLDADDTFMSNSPETQRYAYPAQNTDGYSTGGYSTSGQSGNTAQMVFGNPPRQPKQSINSSSGHALGTQDGFLMKQDEMMTIWGGKLEDAAGAEVAETPSQAPRRGPNGDKLLL